MSNSIFIKFEFFVFVLITFVLPAGIYAYMMWRKVISRKTVLSFGVLLIGIAATSVALLQYLMDYARRSPNLFDDRVFSSEVSMALYLLPALFAGIGINMISHLLITHLAAAEKRYDREQMLPNS